MRDAKKKNGIAIIIWKTHSFSGFGMQIRYRMKEGTILRTLRKKKICNHFHEVNKVHDELIFDRLQTSKIRCVF